MPDNQKHSSLSRNIVNGTACFENANNCLKTNIYSYLETSGGQSSNHFSTPVLIRHLWQLKAVCFPALVSNTHSSIALKKFNNFCARYFLKFPAANYDSNSGNERRMKCVKLLLFL
jgi:hypothetical protein